MVWTHGVLGLALALALPPFGPGPAAAQAREGLESEAAESDSAARRTARPTLRAIALSTNEPRLDGVLDEEIWERAPAATGFTQFEPTPNGPPTQATEARVIYGTDALYVGMRAFENHPDSVVGQLTRRDQESYSDWMAVVIDSYYDRRTAFHFEVNSKGVQTDIYRFDDTSEDRGWDAVWDVAVARDARGWAAEFRIPYSQLRFREGSNQTWGINFVRRIARNDEMVVWAPTTPQDAAIVSRMGDLVGLTDVRSPSRLELMPYSVARLNRAPGSPDNPFYERNALAGAVGADLRFGVTGDLTLNVTLNPDFGQVEADPAQVNLSDFEAFFAEQRPFFVEGSALFNFPIQLGDGPGGGESLFYSRRVGRAPQGSVAAQGGYVDAADQTTILGAWKLSGKTASGWSIGLLSAVTTEETATVAPAVGGATPGGGAPGAGGLGPHFDEAIEPFTNYAVARVAKDFREGRSAVGVVATAVNRESEVADALALRRGAYTGGVDFRHRFSDDTWQVSGYLLGSHIRGSEAAIAQAQSAPARRFQRPDAEHVSYDPTRTSLGGWSGFLGVNKIAGGRWRLGGLFQARSPGFEANDAGFMRESDFLTSVLYVGYDVPRPMGPFRRWRLNFNAWDGRTFGGEHRGNGGNVNGNFQLQNFWGGYAGVNVETGGYSTNTLRGGPLLRNETGWNGWGGFFSDPRKDLQLNVNGNWALRTQSDSWRIGVAPNLRWRPSGRATLNLGGFYNRQAEDLQWVTRLAGSEGADPAYLFGRIDQTTLGITTRLDYAFTPELSLQVYAQPFVSSGGYDDFKTIADPRARAYGDRIARLPHEPGTGSSLSVPDVTGDGVADTFRNPNFDFGQFRSNVVLRWQYRPGSVLFLVWAEGRDRWATAGEFHGMSDIGDLFRQPADDVFMIKVSYWLNP